MNTSNRLGLVASLTLAALLTGCATQDLQRRMAVNYADVDLRSAAGAQVLYRRISSAARDVCSEPLQEDTPLGRIQHERCVRLAIARAVGDLDMPTVTRLAQSRGVVSNKASSGA